MKIRFATAALDGAYLALARLGPADRKKGHGVLLLGMWLAFFFLSLFFLIHYWVYPIHDLYLEWWPYRSINYRSPYSKGFPLLTVLMVLGGWVAYRTSRRCERLINYADTTAKEWVYFAIWMAGVTSATALTKNKYTVIVLVLVHLMAFYLSSKRAT